MAGVKGMTGSGGVRPGAGRKPKAEKYQRPISTAEKRIADRLPAIVDAMLSLALGVSVQEEGKPTIYAKPPDRLACEYLMNRIMGRPTEQAAETETRGEPLQVTATAREQAAIELAEWRQEQLKELLAKVRERREEVA